MTETNNDYHSNSWRFPDIFWTQHSKESHIDQHKQHDHGQFHDDDGTGNGAEMITTVGFLFMRQGTASYRGHQK